jgi:4-hydroxy-tetrahydrodipicolinate synthase
MSGVFPILSTPFDSNDNIIFSDVESEVEYAIDSGVSGVAIALASEVYKLTNSERDELLKRVVNYSNNKIKVCMNTTAESTKLCIEYSKKAQDFGADAVMIAPPSFGGVDSNEIKKYFINVAEKIEIPIFMQDVFDTPISPELAVELSQSNKNLSYLKVEVPPTLPRFNRLKNIAGSKLPIPFGGAGGLFMIEEMRRGSKGTMPVCAIPEMFVKTFNLWNEGKESEAEEYFHKYIPLIRTLGQGLGIWNWLPKYILKRKGVFTEAYAREPSLKPDRNQIYELDRMIERLET